MYIWIKGGLLFISIHRICYDKGRVILLYGLQTLNPTLVLIFLYYKPVLKNFQNVTQYFEYKTVFLFLNKLEYHQTFQESN